jgi:hypothetical protein
MYLYDSNNKSRQFIKEWCCCREQITPDKTKYNILIETFAKDYFWKFDNIEQRDQLFKFIDNLIVSARHLKVVYIEKADIDNEYNRLKESK